MHITEIQSYLHEHIPLSKAMDVQVIEADLNNVKLFAPIGPNINHRETVFGGSASTLAILSAWTLLYIRLNAAGINSRVVIHKNTMSYDKPILSDFFAICGFNDADTWSKFIAILHRKKLSRIEMKSSLLCDSEIVGRFVGKFVALAD